MGSNILFFAWNRSLPGRERISSEHFDQFVAYLTDLQQKGSIAAFEVIFLEPHGGDLNGFFLIRADSAKLDALAASKEWITHMTRAAMHLDNTGTIRAVGGDLVMERMAIWRDSIPG